MEPASTIDITAMGDGMKTLVTANWVYLTGVFVFFYGFNRLPGWVKRFSRG